MGKSGRERNNALLVENKENSHYQANEGGQVVPAEVVLENNDGKERKHRVGYPGVDDFVFNYIQRTAVAIKTIAVGRHNDALFNDRDPPVKKHDRVDRPGAEVDDLHGLELQVQIPGAGHENVGNAKKADSQKTFAEHRNLGTNRQKSGPTT